MSKIDKTIGLSFDINKLDWDKFTNDTDNMSMEEFVKYCTIMTAEGNKQMEIRDRDKYFFEKVYEVRKSGKKLLWLKYISGRRF